MDIRHKVSGSIKIKPVWWGTSCPCITVYLNNTQLLYGLVSDQCIIKFDEELLEGDHSLSVLFHNKQDSDTIIERGLDKAIIVESVEFFGITDNKFIWSANYTPTYPEHMHDQPKVLSGHNYLSWNGRWQLDFTNPIFTWIHKVQNLGWIYE